MQHRIRVTNHVIFFIQVSPVLFCITAAFKAYYVVLPKIRLLNGLKDYLRFLVFFSGDQTNQCALETDVLGA